MTGRETPRDAGAKTDAFVGGMPVHEGRLRLLLLWALLAVLIIAVGYALFDRQRDVIVADRQDQLWRAVSQKVAALEVWRDERIADAELVTRDSSFRELLTRWLSGEQVSDTQPLLTEDLKSLLNSGRYEGIFILDPHGRLRFTLGQFPDRVTRFPGLAERVLALQSPVLADFELPYGPSAGEVRFNLLAPLWIGGELIAILGFQIDPYPNLLPLLQSWPSQASTAETLLTRDVDHSVVFVRQLRFAHGISLGAEITALQHPGPHLAGPGNLVSGPDYRGETVMAVAQQVRRTPWLLVTKMDRAEFLAPARELAVATAATALTVLFLLSLIFVIWRRKEVNRHRAVWFESELRRQLMSAHFDYLTKYANDIILLVDEKSRLIEANDRAVEAYGYPRDKLLQLTWDQLKGIQVFRPLQERWANMRERNALVFESWHKRSDGIQFPVEVSGRMLEVDHRQFFQAIIRDISERKKFQHRIFRLRDLYAALSETSQAIVRFRDLGSLFQSVCEIAVAYGHFRVAWIGLVDRDDNVVRPVAHAGRHEEFFASRIFPLDPNEPGGTGPTARAAREGEVRANNDLPSDPHLKYWRDAAIRYRVNSAAAVPLLQGGTVVGTLTVYAGPRDFFDRQLLELLRKMGLNISFALDAQEQENRRREAERTLVESEARYRQLFDNMSAGVAVFEAGPSGGTFVFRDANQALGRIEGVSPASLIGRTLDEAFPEVKQAGFTQLLNRVSRTGKPERSVLTLSRAGSPPGYRDAYAYQLPSGEIVVVYDDITERRRAEEALRKQQEQLSLVLQSTDDGFWDYDFTTGYVYYSPRWLEILGYEPGDVPSSPEGWGALVHPDDISPAWSRIIAHLTGRADHYEYELRMRAKSGEWRWILARGKVVRRDEHGFPLRLTGTHSDITERKRAEENLRLWAMVFRNSGEGIYITDSERRIISVNEAFTRISGFTQQEIEGRKSSVLRSGEHDEDFYRNMWATIDETGYWQGEVWDRRNNGEVYPKWSAISAVRNSAGELANYIGIFSDISEQKAAEERIRYLAHHDFLTGLPNRSALQDRLEVLIAHARRVKKQVAVLFVDLDRFKNINDSLGHHVGDELLRQVARRLERCVRNEDTVCRLGGDEFIMALAEVGDVNAAAHVAAKVINAVSRPYRLADMELRVTPSIGISVFPDDGENIDELIRNADAAMYLAKEQGRDNFQFFTPELNTRTFKRLSLENSMRRALERGEFSLYYQPQVNLSTGAVIGVEALLRWKRNHEVVAAPAEFIPVAEDSGLIIPLGKWVLTEACRQQDRWSREGKARFPMAVNISALQFRQKNFGDLVRGVLEETGVDPRCLDIELTEGMLMTDAEASIGVLRELKEMGVSVSIDDFGTGYSSLNYLRRFPIDRLKVDQSFVRDLTSDATDRAITGAIIALGKSLGLRVIAEGVETEAELALLRNQHCEAVQGNYFSRPLPPADFTDWLHRSGRLQ